jgi:hypothetical protein
VGKNNQLFLIQKIQSQIYGAKQRTIFAGNNKSIYQYWVYKYPVDSTLG